MRDFTSVSERLPPRELSALMNAYLTPMTEVIHEHRGTIDKYIGDAIMAFWGAPLAEPAACARCGRGGARDAADDALARGAVPRARLARARDRHRLNTGSMNVGDMGSRFRKAYTVLGDAVNLASRLEGLTKVYGVGILCGDETKARGAGFRMARDRSRARQGPRAADLDLGAAGARDRRGEAAELARWNEALALYRARDFAKAGKKFAALPPRPLRDLRERCTAYLAAPPPADWDGTTRFTTK